MLILTMSYNSPIGPMIRKRDDIRSAFKTLLEERATHPERTFTMFDTGNNSQVDIRPALDDCGSIQPQNVIVMQMFGGRTPPLMKCHRSWERAAADLIEKSERNSPAYDLAIYAPDVDEALTLSRDNYAEIVSHEIEDGDDE